MIRFGLPSYWNSTSSTLYGGPNPYHDYFYGGWNLALEQLSGSGGNQSVHYDWGRDLSGTLDGAGGVGGLLATEVGSVWYFPLYDNNGNVTDYVSEDGEVVASYEYDAFGRTIAQSGAMADVFPFRFSTKYYDAEAKLYYYGERFYSPEMGRWLTRDPIEEDGGDNLYAFCGNNGMGRVDFYGLVPEMVGDYSIETDTQVLSDSDFYSQAKLYYPTDPSVIDSLTGGFIKESAKGTIYESKNGSGIVSKVPILDHHVFKQAEEDILKLNISGATCEQWTTYESELAIP